MRQVVLVGPRGTVWLTDLPSTSRERRRGLRGGSPDRHRAMLFEGCRSIHTVGMRHPITVVFLDASLRVIRVVRAPVRRVLVCRRARLVMECDIGADVRMGDRLSRRAAHEGPDLDPRYTLAAAPLWP